MVKDMSEREDSVQVGSHETVTREVKRQRLDLVGV
jgi:hypothetical protein